MKINLVYFSIFFGYASILIFPLDTYRIELPLFSISLFRFSLIFWTLLNFLIALRKKISISRLVLLTLFGSLFSSVLAFTRSAYIEEATPFLLNEVMGFLIIINSIITFYNINTEQLIKTYVLSQIIPLIFSVYTIYQFTINGVIQNDLPPIPIIESYIVPYQFHAPNVSGLPRLWMPFVTGPHLALSMSIAIIYIIFYLWKQKFFAKILLPFYILILFGTFSRTSLIAVTAVLIFGNGINKRIIERSIKVLIMIVSIWIIFSIINLDYFENLARLILRRFNFSLTEDRHFLLVFESLRIWLSEVKTFFFGIGMYNNGLYRGVYTFLPPGSSFLSTYFTTLTERGVIGFIMVFLPFLYVLIKSFRTRKTETDVEKSLRMVTLTILISFMFYDLRILLPVWLHLGICLASLNKKKNWKKHFTA